MDPLNKKRSLQENLIKFSELKACDSFEGCSCQGVRLVGRGHFQWLGSDRPNLGKDSGLSEWKSLEAQLGDLCADSCCLPLFLADPQRGLLAGKVLRLFCGKAGPSGVGAQHNHHYVNWRKSLWFNACQNLAGPFPEFHSTIFLSL